MCGCERCEWINQLGYQCRLPLAGQAKHRSRRAPKSNPSPPSPAAALFARHAAGHTSFYATGSNIVSSKQPPRASRHSRGLREEEARRFAHTQACMPPISNARSLLSLTTARHRQAHTQHAGLPRRREEAGVMVDNHEEEDEQGSEEGTMAATTPSPPGSRPCWRPGWLVNGGQGAQRRPLRVRVVCLCGSESKDERDKGGG